MNWRPHGCVTLAPGCGEEDSGTVDVWGPGETGGGSARDSESASEPVALEQVAGTSRWGSPPVGSLVLRLLWCGACIPWGDVCMGRDSESDLGAAPRSLQGSGHRGPRCVCRQLEELFSQHWGLNPGHLQ